MSTVLITGGTGLIGTALVKKLTENGYEVIILTRSPKKSKNEGISYAWWNTDRQVIDEKAIAAADHIIHLAGANVGEKRWTQKRKKEIVDSRVKSGELICTALQKTNHKVSSFISASAIGWYGPDLAIPNPHPFKEEALHADDFLGSTCYKWEQSVSPVKEMGIRLCCIRTGIVLSADGGALKEFLNPLKYGVAAVPGSGKQIVSWIHIDDLAALYIEAMENTAYEGAYNAVAPHPVSTKHLVTALAKAVNGKFHITVPVPALALKILLGEMSVEVLKSVTVNSQKVQDAGFRFVYQDIESAVGQVIAARKS
ncbi:TIGR01777 family oxidoreductase [Niabella aquatica]